MDKEQMKINERYLRVFEQHKDLISEIVRIQGGILRGQLRIAKLLDKIIDEVEELKKKQK